MKKAAQFMVQIAYQTVEISNILCEALQIATEAKKHRINSPKMAGFKVIFCVFATVVLANGMFIF